MAIQKYENCTISSEEEFFKSALDYRKKYHFKNVTFKNIRFKITAAFDNYTFDNATFYNCNLTCACFNYHIAGNIVFDRCNLTKAELPMDYWEHYIFKENNINAPKQFVVDRPFYAYKYAYYNLIILEIPKGTRCIKTTSLNKCKCDRAKVISILNPDGTYSGITSCNSWYDDDFVYTVGDDVVEPDCNYLWSVSNCPGIHFFMDIKDAYNFYINTICRDRQLWII